MTEWSQNKEMRWEIKRIERGKTGEDIRREEGERSGIKTWGRKWNEEAREWTEEIIQDLPRKWDHQTHNHQETELSSSSSMCWRNDWWSGREWKGGKMKEGGQGMKVIEKARWEGNKTVGAERVWEQGWREEWMKWREFEESQVWKDQKRHQMEERRDCCCGESEKTKWEWRWMNERVEREIWFCWGWKTLQREGLSVGCYGDKEQTKMKMREGRREKWDERFSRP